MNLSLNLSRVNKQKDHIENLIAIHLQPINDNLIFINDFANEQSYISDDRSNSRTLIASYYFDKELGVLGGGIDAYLVYTKKEGILLVGTLTKSSDDGDKKEAILFELPLSDTQEAITRAQELGFRVDLPDEEIQWIDADLISKTYHNGSPVITTDTSTTFQKTISDKYHLYITRDI